MKALVTLVIFMSAALAHANTASVCKNSNGAGLFNKTAAPMERTAGNNGSALGGTRVNK